VASGSPRSAESLDPPDTRDGGRRGPDGGDQRRSQLGDGADPQGRTLVPALPGQLDELLGRLQQPARPGQQLLAGRGQSDLSGVADEQLHPQLLLEAAQALREGRLRHAQRPRGVPEVLLVGDGDEEAQMPDEIHLSRRLAWWGPGAARRTCGKCRSGGRGSCAFGLPSRTDG